MKSVGLTQGFALGWYERPPLASRQKVPSPDRSMARLVVRPFTKTDWPRSFEGNLRHVGGLRRLGAANQRLGLASAFRPKACLIPAQGVALGLWTVLRSQANGLLHNVGSTQICLGLRASVWRPGLPRKHESRFQ